MYGIYAREPFKSNFVEKVLKIGMPDRGVSMNSKKGPIVEYRKGLEKSNPDLLTLFDTLLVQAKSYNSKALYQNLSTIIDPKISENYKRMYADAKAKKN